MIDPDEFTVGWIAAIPIELTAARGMLDEDYGEHHLKQNKNDNNIYHLGKIGDHKVAITCLKKAGTNSAASAVTHMGNTFTKLKFKLMVGIGGGVPSNKHDIRLGDVVVSVPSGSHPGVIAYEHGKYLKDGVFQNTGSLYPPPTVLLHAVNKLASDGDFGNNHISDLVTEMRQKLPIPQKQKDYSYQGREYDLLFPASYSHQETSDTHKDSVCKDCDQKYLIPRAPDTNRVKDEPVIHRGLIASGNGVMKDAVKRDKWGAEHDVLCFEMEAAGLQDDSPFLVIRGICDYADSHKNKRWQPYAAGVAAAYAKELLRVVPVSDVELAPPVAGMYLFLS